VVVVVVVLLLLLLEMRTGCSLPLLLLLLLAWVWASGGEQGPSGTTPRPSRSKTSWLDIGCCRLIPVTLQEGLLGMGPQYWASG
jgi:hypothetical protein